MKSEAAPIAAPPHVAPPVAPPPKRMSDNRPPVVNDPSLSVHHPKNASRPPVISENHRARNIWLVASGMVLLVVYGAVKWNRETSVASSSATVAPSSAATTPTLTQPEKEARYAEFKRRQEAANRAGAEAAAKTPVGKRVYSVWELEGVGETMLKQSLRDPDSYQRIGWTTYSNKLDGVDIPAPFTVHGLKYRAKNGFGGYDVGEQIYIFGPNGLVPYSNNK